MTARCWSPPAPTCRTKWPHLARPGERLLRASVGRFGDERFAAMDDDELVVQGGGRAGASSSHPGEPTSTLVTRWTDALPQYRVHHLLRVTGIEAAVQRLPALAVAGAAYRGVGIPACVASGRAAARPCCRPCRAAGRRRTPPLMPAPESQTTSRHSRGGVRVPTSGGTWG